MNSGNLEQITTLATKRDDPGYSQLSGYIPKALALRFKSTCTLKEVTISEALESAVTRWLDEEESSSTSDKKKTKRKSSQEE